MEPREFVRILQRNWALIIALVLLTGALSTGYSLLKTPQYQASAKAIITTDSATSSSDLAVGTSYAEAVVKTYADVATTPYVLDPVIRDLKLSDTFDQLSSRVTAAAPLDETIVQVTTTDSSPTQAARISNAIMSQLGSSVVTLAPDSANRTASARMTLVQSASAPTVPISPNVPLNAALGLVLGLVLGLIAGFIRNRADTTIVSKDDIGLATDFPVLGSLGFRRSASRVPLVVEAQRNFGRVDEVAALRSELIRANPTGRPIAVVVTAPVQGQGTSTTTTNLAVALGTTGRRVLVVDANLRHPTAAAILGVGEGVGLADVLEGGVDLDRVVVPTSYDGVSVLTAGSLVEEPSRLFRTIAVESLIDELRRRFDVVLLDGPPMLLNADAGRLARAADGTIVVTASGRSDRLRLQRALTDLDESGAWVIGVVLTMAPGRTAQQLRSTKRTRGQRSGEGREVPAEVEEPSADDRALRT